MPFKTTHRPRAATARALAFALLAGFSAASLAATQRAQVVQRGGYAIVGNTLAHDCAAGVPAPTVGIVGACGTNTADSAPDVFWRADSPVEGSAQADTSITVAQARSTAVLALPAGAEVTHAYLYWAGNLAQPDAAIVFERPGAGGFTQNVTALNTFQAAVNNGYLGVADVTALVTENGSGAYRVSGVGAPNIVNANNSNWYSGWWIVVLYQRDGDPVRSLAVYDGLDAVVDGNPMNYPLTGFHVPPTGGDATVGIVALDGDATTGDRLLFNGSEISNAQNPADNFFNSTRSANGSTVSTPGDLPLLNGAPASLSGLDIDIVDVSSHVTPGDTSASLSATTSLDVYLVASVVAAFATTAPDFAATMSVTDLDGAAAMPGDVLEYAVAITGAGTESAQSVLFDDVLPAGVTYEPGSLVVTAGENAGAKTDAHGDDQAEFVVAENRIVFRLGAGAGATQGGQLAVGTQTTLRFRARIDDACTLHASIANQGAVRGVGALSGAPADRLTDADAATAGAQPAQTTVDVDCLTLALPTTPARGRISTSIAGFSCSAGTCATPVATGATVTLIAEADAGYAFAGWGGDCAVYGTNVAPSFAVDAPKQCSASFAGVPQLVLTVTDDRDYARYGSLANYVVTLRNEGTAGAGPVAVVGSLPPQLDAAQMTWTCIADGGATCMPGGTGALADASVGVPAGASAVWHVGAPIRTDAVGETVIYSVTAGTTNATDTTTLVIFRDDFETASAAPHTACEPLTLADGAVRTLTLPPPSAAAIDVVLHARAADGSGLRVERLNVGREPRVRLLGIGADGAERASVWSVVATGATLAIAVEIGVEDSSVMLEGAIQPLAIALTTGAPLHVDAEPCE